MKTLALFLGLILTASAGEPVSLPELVIKDRTYQKVTVELKTPHEARITHQDGSKTVDPSLLPFEIQKKIGFDETRAAVSRESLAAQLARYARSKEIAENTANIQLKVSSVAEDGLFGEALFMRNGAPLAVRFEKDGEAVVRLPIFLQTKTAGRDFVDDATYEFKAALTGSRSYSTILGTTKTVRAFTDVRFLDK